MYAYGVPNSGNRSKGIGMKTVTRIECGSEAYRHLTDAMHTANAEIRDISLMLRDEADGRRTVQIKVGEGTWTTPLDIV